MRIISTCLLVLAAVGLAGCGYTPEQRATSGAALGAGTGAIIAAAAGANPGIVIASSLLGAGAGAVIGANTRPPPRPAYWVPPHRPRRCVEFVEDMYGRPYCRAFYGY